MKELHDDTFSLAKLSKREDGLILVVVTLTSIPGETVVIEELIPPTVGAYKQLLVKYIDVPKVSCVHFSIQ